jgi:hypothetical protein
MIYFATLSVSSDYVASNELETMWKEAVLACFKVLSNNSPAGTDENHEEPQLRWSVPWLKIKSGTSNSHVRNVQVCTRVSEEHVTPIFMLERVLLAT